MTSQIVRKRTLAVLLAGAFALAGIASLASAVRPTSAAEIYYADTPSGYRGGMPHVDDSEFVACDRYYIDRAYEVEEVPSYNNGDSGTTNYCAPATGCNIIGFYDRFYPNLIPNFEPGMTVGSGEYMYFPDVGFSQIDDTFEDLCDRMDVNVGGPGTSEQDFRDGLKEYVEAHGYHLSYSSIYNDPTSVNLTALGYAGQTNRVSVLFLSSYNYVESIEETDGGLQITKYNSNNAHVMMAYGLIKIRYYNGNSVFRTDTYLQVVGGYYNGSKGYLKVEDYLEIDEALIITIS